MSGSFKLARLAVCAVFLGCVSNACGGDSETGESQFLSYCESGCGDGLECIGGVCTRACVFDESDDCDEVSGLARCTYQRFDPAGADFCDVGCRSGADCAVLGVGYGCDAGYCRVGSSGSAAPACLEAYELYDAIARTTGDCWACSCDGPSPSCEVAECPGGVPVYPCPEQLELSNLEMIEVRSDPSLEGDALTLDLQFGGGCEDHRLGLCFEPATLAPNSTTVLRLVHEIETITPCSAVLYHTVKFDLSPLGRAYEVRFQTDGGVIETTYGIYGFGAPTCDERHQWAQAKRAELMDRTDRTCATDADCAGVSPDLSCAYSCATVISVGAVDAFESELERIDRSVCDPYTEAGCPSQAPGSCPLPPGTMHCETGICVHAVDPLCAGRDLGDCASNDACAPILGSTEWEGMGTVYAGCGVERDDDEATCKPGGACGFPPGEPEQCLYFGSGCIPDGWESDPDCSRACSALGPSP